MIPDPLATAFRALLLKRCGDCPFDDVELIQIAQKMLVVPIVGIVAGPTFQKVAPALREISIVIHANHYTDIIQILKHYNIDTTKLEQARQTKYN